jgi:anti-sigma28 factor (negative regulator of flagellin synthesis)
LIDTSEGSAEEGAAAENTNASQENRKQPAKTNEPRKKKRQPAPDPDQDADEDNETNNETPLLETQEREDADDEEMAESQRGLEAMRQAGRNGELDEENDDLSVNGFLDDPEFLDVFAKKGS